MLQYPSHTSGKLRLWRNQADDQMPVGSEVVKMAGMHEHTIVFNQRDGKFFIGTDDRHPHGRIPTALDLQARAEFLLAKLPVEFAKIRSRTFRQLLLQRTPRGQ